MAVFVSACVFLFFAMGSGVNALLSGCYNLPQLVPRSATVGAAKCGSWCKEPWQLVRPNAVFVFCNRKRRW